MGSLFGWRSPGAFLSAVRNLVDRGAIPRDDLAIRFIGNVPDLDLQGLEGIVEATGYVAHDVALAWMKSADALVLINTETTNILAKAFEYLAVGKPILAFTRPGPTADLIERYSRSIAVDPEAVEGIEGALVEAYGRWRSGRLTAEPDPEYLARYSRRATARHLGRIFDSLSD